MSKILGMILAGGEGTRLHPLTSARTKPAVPFGGNYRIIDFVLSNFVNSGILSTFVLTQFKSHSLMKHLRQGWRVSGVANAFIDPVPAQMRLGKRWYEGTADAIYQNVHLLEDEEPDMVTIFGGDHIYYMDIEQMMHFHNRKNAVLTVAALKVPVHEAYHFGIIEVNEDWQMIGFQEKPKSDPKTIPGDPHHVLASMGNYIFNADVLCRELEEDGKDEASSHDFGKDIIPKLYPKDRVFVYDFTQNNVPGMEEKNRGYWRDVGTLDTYWEANMDLVSIDPVFNLYNRKWPLITHRPPHPPAKFVHSSESRTGHGINSIIGSGSVISGGLVEESVLGHSVRVNSFSHVSQSVVMDNVTVERGARVRKAIIDKNVIIGAGTIIGEDLEKDRKRFPVTENGIVVVPKGTHVKKK